MPDNTGNDNNDNVFDLFGPDEDNIFGGDDNDDDRVSDPAVVAFMDQQSAEHNAAQDEFLNHYGFTHDCHCDKDYSSGNLVEVTECYANMTVDALGACAALTAENKLLRGMISSAMGLAISEHLPNLTDEEEVSAAQDDDAPAVI